MDKKLIEDEVRKFNFCKYNHYLTEEDIKFLAAERLKGKTDENKNVPLLWSERLWPKEN